MSVEEWDEVPEIEHDPVVPPDRHAPPLPAVPPAFEALPGLARVAATAWWHTTEWSVRGSARTGRRLARAVTDPAEAARLAQEATEAAAVVGAIARAVASGVPVHKAVLTAGEALGELAESPGSADGRRDHPATLRERGAELLQRSRDVRDDDATHPAYERILGDLAPDEARILLLLLQGGPQPSVDVRTGGPIGIVSSQLVAPGLSMIGARAGCRHVEQVPAYLNNLFRLGLVWFSREQLRDPLEYQVVEAQPDVLDAMHSVTFPKVVRRSIHLTPFGEDFCRTCLVEEEPADGYPAHAVPLATDAARTPPDGGERQ